MERDRTELPRALACAFLFFLVIGSYYVAKSVRDAVLIYHFAPGAYPKFYLTVGLITLPVGSGIALLARAWPRQRLVPFVFLLCAAVFFGFWKLAAHGGASDRVAGAYFIWASVYNVVTICLFWSFTNDLFTKEQGRRLYGLIGSGGPLGAIFGSAIAARYAERLGTAGLLPVVVIGLVLCAILLLIIGGGDPVRAKALPASPSSSAAAPKEIVRILLSPYVATIATIVVLHTFCETTVDLQSKGLIKEVGLSQDALTRFNGTFFAAVNVLALVMSLVVTTLVHRLWGPRPGLLVLPIATLLLAPLLLPGREARDVWLPFFQTLPLQAAVAAGVGVPLAAFAYSIWASSKELLYVPTDASVKFQAKPVIDTFGFRVGDMLASLLALPAGAGGVAHLHWFGGLGLAGCVVWCVFAWRAGTRFQAAGTTASAASGSRRSP